MSTTPTARQQANAALEKLTPQRRKFVLGYCATFNATKAAQAAGYSKKTARNIGANLLTLVNIKAAVKSVLDMAAMDPEEIAARWTRLASAGLSDFYTVVDYQEPTKVQQLTAEYIPQRIAEIQYQVDFEELAHQREHLVSPEDGPRHLIRQLERKNQIIRLQIELELNPNGTRTVDGPPVTKQRVELDLVKAESLGLLDLVKTIAPTEFGLKVELRSPDAALDNLAKWRGMFTTKVDVTSGGKALPRPYDLSRLSPEQLAQLEALTRAATPPELPA